MLIIVANSLATLITSTTMAHTHAAEKAQRQTAKHTARNHQVKERIKDSLKRLDKMSPADLKAALPKFTQLLDKAAKVRIIPSNKAARLKSRLMKKAGATK